MNIRNNSCHKFDRLMQGKHYKQQIIGYILDKIVRK